MLCGLRLFKSYRPDPARNSISKTNGNSVGEGGVDNGEKRQESKSKSQIYGSKHQSPRSVTQESNKPTSKVDYHRRSSTAKTNSESATGAQSSRPGTRKSSSTISKRLALEERHSLEPADSSPKDRVDVPDIQASRLNSSSNKARRERQPSPGSRDMAAAVATQSAPVGGGGSIVQQEKDFVAHFSDNQHTLSPSEVANAPQDKDLGQSSKSLRVEDFDLVRTLGTGTFARVWLVRLRNSREEDKNKVFALKVLRKAEVVRLKQVDHVNHERAILADVAGHPFITTLITTFSDFDSLYMLLDYCPGGEIFSYLRKAKRFSENASRFYVAEMVLILEFLHETEGVAYRDLKPENILLDADGHVKLVDFGFAKRVRDRETYTLCGTPEYLAPEVIQSLGHTTAVDWWALGILLYEFLTGYPPFWHQQPMEIYKQILNKPITFPPANSTTPPISEAAKDLIVSLCTVDRHKRLGNIEGGARRVKDHPFFNGVKWDDVYYRKYRGPIIPPLRYPGDAQCFDLYPDEKDEGRRWTPELGARWDDRFKDF